MDTPLSVTSVVRKMVKMAKKKYDIAVLGWWYGVNYGSVLTYYGLNKALEKLNKRVIMVHETLGYNSWRVKWSDDIMPMRFAKRVNYHYTEQIDYTQLDKWNELADTFIVGSDQLWNPGIPRVNGDLLLDFVSDQNKRIAYGTSISRGEEYFNNQWITDMRVNLAKFDGISVRENGAQALLAKYTGIQASKVVDPVYLLEKEDYLSLANQATSTFTGHFMTLFLLDPNDAKKEVAIKIADKLGYDRIVIVPNPEANIDVYQKIFTDDRFEILEEAKPENMLNAYANAGYIVTDSFHGSVFATVFEKPFNSFYNVVRGAARFEELMTLLALGDTRRVTEELSEQDVANHVGISHDIDYVQGLQNIAEQRKASLQWLQDSIDGKTPQAFAKRFVDMLTTNAFKFYREGDEDRPIAQRVVFDQYGVISGIPSPNERYWRYENMQLQILNAQNKVTTVFDIEQSDVDRTQKIVGRFVANPNIKHVLAWREE